MKPLLLIRWSGTLLSPRTRPCPIAPYCFRLHIPYPLRHQSTAPTQSPPAEEPKDYTTSTPLQQPSPTTLTAQSNSPRISSGKLLRYPSPPPTQALRSAKLAALHARLSLSPRLPLEILARCLIDTTADPDPAFNNSPLAILGSSLMGYYTSEAILCRHPRLPTEVVFAAIWAYSGSKTLSTICREWGVEFAAEPGGEVDAGLLQCRRLELGDGRNAPVIQAVGSIRPNAGRGWKAGVSSRTVYDNQFGEEITTSEMEEEEAASGEVEKPKRMITLEDACSKFIQALLASVYLHLGRRAAKLFFNEHILSRHLDVSRLFEFKAPTRDLAKLCAREGFTDPVARILSETGRLSRTPVFVVGVFAGKEKLGEGQGASLNEARIRAAVNALKGWYLYSPIEVRVPSDVEGVGSKWTPVLVDGGEVVV